MAEKKNASDAQVSSEKSKKPLKTRSKEKKPTDKLADRTRMTRFLQGVFGDAQKKILKRLYKKVLEINALEPKYKGMSDEELAKQTEILRERAGKGKEKDLNAILADSFAVAREASNRILGMRPFDVQLIGGMVLHEGNVAEMKTGEGKTLVAMLPAYLNALTGKGVHVVTVNDYLAQRDAGWNAPVYHFLGLSVGVIINQASFIYDPEFENTEHEDERFRHLKPATRKEAYAADITYGTNNEFGFDYLRDNMVDDPKYLRQRELNFAIVDEVDSILIDEARTPLIISAPAGENPDLYYKFARIVAELGENDYVYDEKRRSVALTDEGVEKVEDLLGIKNLYSTKHNRHVYHIEQALRAQVIFKRDKDYVVTNSGDVVIVDEHTGRLMQGRRYNEGLHQAIEAKEGVAVKQESMTLATISFQNFFRLYHKLSGMTGTAFTEAEEFQQIYSLDVIQIPPNRPIQRVDRDDLIYKTEAGKLRAIAAEIKKYHEKGQPVLVGSGSIANNERIAKYLDSQGIKYELLNAKNNEREAAIVEKAGEKGAVTLATNLAGRGTDIKLGKGVKELGGLVVIGSERHDSRRVDNQLRGRGGRQGDPGTTQFFVSCEDDLMRIFQGDRIAMLMDRLGVDENTPIQNKSVSKTLEAAQKRIEGFNFDSRKNVVQYDNVINRHRKVVYTMRRKILDGKDIHDEIQRLMKNIAEDLGKDSSRINPKFVEDLQSVIQISTDRAEAIGKMRKEKDRVNAILEEIERRYEEKEQEIGEEIIAQAERKVYLQVLDILWMQHLENMQHLREGIHWRSVGQRDPLVEYRSESQKLFNGLEKNLREEVLRIMLSLHKQEVERKQNDEYESELTKMAESATEKGVNEISAGEKSLDKEFSEDGTAGDSSDQKVTKNNNANNQKRNASRKAKKKQRQNRKKGKQR